MKRLIQFPTEGGETITVEVKDEDGQLGHAGRGGDVAQKAAETFEAAMSRLKFLTSKVVSTLPNLNDPDELSLEFGVKLSAEAGVVIASASAEANITVKLSWKRGE